jgi:hypothetical protein
MNTLAKGTTVIVCPVAYPLERWSGVVERKTPNGYSVTYYCGGIRMRSTFSAKELRPCVAV